MRQAALCLLACWLPSPWAVAHEVRPAYLELQGRSGGVYDVTWKVPVAGDQRPKLRPQLPAACTPTTSRTAVLLATAIVERWRVDCGEERLAGEIKIVGLESTLIDVLVRVRDGADASGSEPVRAMLLRPQSPSWVRDGDAPDRSFAGASYLRLGVEHIAGGLDHLLFVAVLLLLIRGGWRLVRTITAFTVAHSITLGLATLGFVHVPGSPVEAVIALSITFVAAELIEAERGRPTLTARRPWTVAGGFGLLHGLGFAGALAVIGLPTAEIPTALLFFNLGVELGQLFFVALLLAMMAAWRRLEFRWPTWCTPLPAYGIGTLATFWFFQRLASF